MTLREREDQVFRKYRLLGERIIPDGAISHEYESARPRVLVILKEANDPNAEWAADGGDIRGFGNWGGRPATWNNLARWSALSTERLQFDEIDVSTREGRAVYLRRIAVMNLKKTPGGSRANRLEIRTYAVNHKVLLEEQFRLYKPDITLAGGTFEVLKELRCKSGAAILCDLGKCFSYFKDEDLGICIDFYHPQYRIKHLSLFEYLRQQLEYHGCHCN